MYQETVNFIQELYKTKDFIPLHEPRFAGNEKKYLEECIDSTFVSSVGKFVNQFEEEFAQAVGAKYAIATVNGTAALHISLILAGVEKDDEVITQPLTFIATANAISYIGAQPIFLDVDLETLGLSAVALESFLKKHCVLSKGHCLNRTTGKIIKACVPMHTFGHPCEIDAIKIICDEWNIVLIEDAAESLGSYYKNQHTGTFGKIAAFSFNGNKIITSGGGGAIVTDDEDLAKQAKHLTTTAKVPHKWEYVHDTIGFNYRLPNLNAALLVAQLEQLPGFLVNKRKLADTYKHFFETQNMQFITEPQQATSNYWLNAVLLNSNKQRDAFLEFTNNNGVMTRPIWQLMNKLEMFKNCQTDKLVNATFLEERVVNIPSSITQ
jgi:aminotransferase in exopolysaccharide biosynthesis